MNEGTLGIHEIELVIDAREHLGDGRCVRDHADSTHHLSQVTARNNGWRLVVNAAFESRRRPVDELDGSLGLDGGN